MFLVLFLINSINSSSGISQDMFKQEYWAEKSKEWLKSDFSLDTSNPEIKDKIKDGREYLLKTFSQRPGLKKFLKTQIESNGTLAPTLNKQIKENTFFGSWLSKAIKETSTSNEVNTFQNDTIKFEGEIFYGGDYVNIAVSGNYAYTTGLCGVEVFDISDKYKPKRIGNCKTPGEPYGIRIKGNYAFVADGLAGLTVVNISNPAAPYIVTSYQPFGYCWNLRIRGDTAYVADFLGFSVVDISNPASPVLVGKAITPGLSVDVEVSGNYAYLVDLISIDKTGTFYVFDMTIPWLPLIVGYCSMPQYSYPWELTLLDDKTAYVTDFISIVPVSIDNPNSPSVNGRGFSFGLSLGIRIKDGYGYVASGVGLSKVCFWLSSHPFPIGFCYVPTFVQNVDTGSDFACVIGPRGFGISDINGWFQLQLDSYWESPGYAKRSFVVGNYAYIASDWGGLVVANVANPTSPVITGRCKTGGLLAIARDVYVSGNYAYVANDLEGIAVVDVSNPSSPQVVGSCRTRWAGYGIDVVDTIAYIADYLEGLTRVSIANPTHPYVIDGVATWGISQAVKVNGKYAYLADDLYGITVVDISTMNQLTHCWTTPGLAMDVAVKDNMAYAANFWDGEVNAEFYSPDSIVVKHIGATPGWAYGIDVKCDTWIYVANDKGLTIYDVTNPDTAIEMCTYHTKYTAYDALVVDGSGGKPALIYVPNYYWYTILSFKSCEDAPVAEKGLQNRVDNKYEIVATPNPFSKKVVIELKSSKVSELKDLHLRIYDLAGREVKSFPLTTNNQQLTTTINWNGENNDGKAVLNGIYFVKFGSKTIKIQIIR